MDGLCDLGMTHCAAKNGSAPWLASTSPWHTLALEILSQWHARDTTCLSLAVAAPPDPADGFTPQLGTTRKCVPRYLYSKARLSGLVAQHKHKHVARGLQPILGDGLWYRLPARR